MQMVIFNIKKNFTPYIKIIKYNLKNLTDSLFISILYTQFNSKDAIELNIDEHLTYLSKMLFLVNVI